MTKPTVYVTRRIPDEGLDLLRETCDLRVWEGSLPPAREVLLREVAGVDGVVTMLSDRVDAAFFDAAPTLKVVSNYAVGFDNIDVPEATRRAIPVGNTPGVLTDTTADLAFALLMAAARRIVEGAQYVQSGAWKTWGPMTLLGQDVLGTTLGIVGMGRIGQAMARRGPSPRTHPDLHTLAGAHRATRPAGFQPPCAPSCRAWRGWRCPGAAVWLCHTGLPGQ